MNAVLEVTFGMVFIIGLLYIAQFVVGIFNWPARHNNVIYRFLGFLTSPVTKAVRTVTPAKVQDKHVPVVAFFLLFWLYIALIFARLCVLKPHLCQSL
jgi:uncharacterized protein YggT (Ycf19 family)